MSKLTSLSSAISQFVHDGDLVSAAGFTHLIPFAAGHEIVRPRIMMGQVTLGWRSRR